MITGQLKYCIATSKLFIIVLLLYVISFDANAQYADKLPYSYQRKLDQANEYFYLFNYIEAVPLYEDIISKFGKDPTIVLKIADSYRFMNYSYKAEKWYRTYIWLTKSEISAECMLNFGQILVANEKYEEAIYWFEKFSNYPLSEESVKKAIQSIKNMPQLFIDKKYYSVKSLEINSEYTEFNPIIYENSIIFLSDKQNTKPGYFTWYQSKLDSKENFQSPKKFKDAVKSTFNHAPLCFYNNNTQMIYSQNYNTHHKSNKKIKNFPVQLLQSERGKSGKWKKGHLLPFNDGKHSFSHPTITSNGKILYFVSDMPDGYGGTDIYSSTFKYGAWTSPVNLGSKVNTAGNESFPFIYNDSILYFSSNGHGGLGGLDIVKYHIENKTLENLNFPINSQKDDFSIFINSDGLSGYFASNRIEGKGSDDIYEFKKIRTSFTIKVIDKKTNEPVPIAEIYDVNNYGKMIGNTGNNGICTITVPICEELNLIIMQSNYQKKTFIVEPLKKDNYRVLLSPISEAK